VAGPPKRFAQLLGAIFTVTAAVLTFGSIASTSPRSSLGILLVPASLEAFVGFCVGCQVFGWLMRAGVIPASVCVECADISQRVGAPA
jgi:hypothetical protein